MTTSRRVYVCSTCGKTVEATPNNTRGWLIGTHENAEKAFHGEMVIRCPKHITNYAIRNAANGRDDIR